MTRGLKWGLMILVPFSIAGPEVILHPDITSVAEAKNTTAFRVCDAARDDVSLNIQIADDPEWPQGDARFFYVKLPSLGFSAVIVIVCPTIPILYLLPRRDFERVYIILIGTPEKRIKSAVNEGHTRNARPPLLHDLSSSPVEVIKSELITCQQMVSNDPRVFDMTDRQFATFFEEECGENRVRRMSALGKLTESFREELCSSAVERVNQFDERGRPPVKQTGMPGEVQIFGFPNKEPGDAPGNRRVALACSTLPRIYVLYVNSRLNKDMQILIVQNN